eukprot:TRINITY_DN276_c0_g1_i4.p1 TRINITY_DN276_c0_g1~~TRINITY_DN276_c0_g1_i4.p1  ORF type:complete len:158 (-),score=77.78 TRINITY_DN276_c0_g1_i4:2-475(-)
MIRRPPRSTQSRSAASDVYKRQGKGKAKGAGCCGGADVAPDGKIPPPDPVGMDRSCTDILFLLIFMAFWFGMIVCASMGFSKGDIDTLFYFIDYQGNKCGKNGPVSYTHLRAHETVLDLVCRLLLEKKKKKNKKELEYLMKNRSNYVNNNTEENQKY